MLATGHSATLYHPQSTRMEPQLTYEQLPDTAEDGRTLSKAEAKEQRRCQIEQDAYAIYDAPSRAEALDRLQAFSEKWEPFEPKAIHTFKWGINRTFEFYKFEPALLPADPNDQPPGTFLPRISQQGG